MQLVVVALAGAVVGAWLSWIDIVPAVVRICGLITLVAGLAMVPFYAPAIFTTKPGLIVNIDGIHYQFGLGRFSIPWTDIESLALWPIPNVRPGQKQTQMVGIRLKTGSEQAKGLPAMRRLLTRIDKRLTGRTISFVGSWWRLSPEELLSALESWRQFAGLQSSSGIHNGPASDFRR